MSFFISLTRWRTASSLFSLLLRDGFLKYLRSLSYLYIPSLITRFFSFCIARFGSSPRLTFTVIILLFSCYSVAAIRVSLNTTRVVYHIVKRLSSGRAPAQMGARITQKVGDKSGAVLCCGVPLRWHFDEVSGSESYPCDSPNTGKGKLGLALMPGFSFIYFCPSFLLIF